MTAAFEAIRWARAQYVGGTATKAVLLALASYADEHGRCWPSTRTLADAADSTQKHVRICLGKLRDLGLVNWTTGTGKVRVYSLELEMIRVRGAETSVHRSQVPVGAATEVSQTSALRSGGPRTEVSQTSELPGTTNRTAKEEASAAERGSEAVSEEADADPVEVVPSRVATATAIVAARADSRTGILRSERVSITREVDRLLGAKADPAHIPAALDVAFDAREWRIPGVRRMEMSYAKVRDAAAARNRPAAASPSISTADRRIRESHDAFDRVWDHMTGGDGATAAAAHDPWARVSALPASASTAVVVDGEIVRDEVA